MRARNKSIAIFTTHFLKDIEVYCDKIGIINYGKFLCIERLDLIKKQLGGYIVNVEFIDPVQESNITYILKKYAFRIILRPSIDKKSVKYVLNKITSITELFKELLHAKATLMCKDFTIN